MGECAIVDSFLLGLCVIVTKDLPSFSFVCFCFGFLVALFATGRPVDYFVCYRCRNSQCWLVFL